MTRSNYETEGNSGVHSVRLFVIRKRKKPLCYRDTKPRKRSPATARWTSRTRRQQSQRNTISRERYSNGKLLFCGTYFEDGT